MISDFTDVIQKEPAVARHYLNREKAHRELGRVKEAEADAKTAKDLEK